MIAHLLRNRATKEQIEEMLLFGAQIKFVVDVESDIMVGGGMLHVEGERMLLEQGSRQENLWAGSWFPKERKINFFSTVNERPRQNRSQDILDPTIRTRAEKIIRRFLEDVLLKMKSFTAFFCNNLGTNALERLALTS